MFIFKARIFAFENFPWGVSQNSLSITPQPRSPFRRQLLFVATALVAVALACGCSGYMPSKTATSRNDSLGIAASLAATPTFAEFGSVAVGTQNTQTVQIRNPGSQSVVIERAAVAGNGFTVSGLPTPLTVASGGTTSFTVKFLPTASGSVTGSVVLQGTSGGPLVSIFATGTGTTAARTLQLSSSVLNFGNETVGGSSTLGVNLVNAGNSSITVSQVSASGTGFSVLSGVSGATISAGQSATLQIVFAPKAAGSAAGTVTVTSNAGNSPGSLQVSGTGVAGSTSSQGSSTAHTVALSWNPSTSSNIAGYNVYRSTTAGGSYARINSSPTNATKYADGSVAAGETYYYVVTAVSSNGTESLHSNQISAVIP
jgi:hypothetical protein